MYNQTVWASTSVSPVLIDSQLAEMAFLKKGVIGKAKVIVLDPTENKNTQITKVFDPHFNICRIPISQQQWESLQLGIT